MKAGRLRRDCRPILAVVALAVGLAAAGLGQGARGDEKMSPEMTGAAKAKAKAATASAKTAEAKDEAKPAGRASAALPKPDYLDEMIAEAWEASSIKPSRPATDEEYMRRVYLDLIGRIPNLAEAQGFLSSKESGKRAKLVEYLLNHPDYPRNFATKFSILLIGRNRQERQVDREALTAWLRRQFADNQPWTKVAYELITATGSNKENGAVNFPLAHLEMGAVPLTSITTRVFLGQQIQCTQCHDHPSNDWKQSDFWGINAFFKGIRREDVEKEDATGASVYDHTDMTDEGTDAYASYDKRNGLVGIAFPKFLDGRKIPQDASVNRREALARFIADPKSMDFSRAFVNRMWGHFQARGFVQPVDDFGPHNPPSHPELLDKLAEDFIKSGHDVKQLIRWITASQAYNLSSVMNKTNEKDETLYSHMALKPFTPEQLFDSLIAATSAHKAGGGGETAKKRNAWLRQFLFTFSNDEGEEANSFQGTIPQALMMMNGDLMAEAVGGKPGSFLADLLVQAQRQRRSPDIYIVNNLYLAALSRYPTAAELRESRKILESFPDTRQVLEDMFWALLNSNEFILNR